MLLLWGHRGQTALEVARKVLARPSMHGLEIFSFRAVPSRKRLAVRLDKVGLSHRCTSLVRKYKKPIQSSHPSCPFYPRLHLCEMQLFTPSHHLYCLIQKASLCVECKKPVQYSSQYCVLCTVYCVQSQCLDTVKWKMRTGLPSVLSSHNASDVRNATVHAVVPPVLSIYGAVPPGGFCHLNIIYKNYNDKIDFLFEKNKPSDPGSQLSIVKCGAAGSGAGAVQCKML